MNKKAEGFGIEHQNLGAFLEKKYIKNQSYQNRLIIKVNPPFLNSSMKKNRKDLADF